jgi:hypothetical protein
MPTIEIPIGVASHPEGPLPALKAGEYVIGQDPNNALANRVEFRKVRSGRGADRSLEKFQYAIDGWRVNYPRPTISKLLQGVNIRGAQTEYIAVGPTLLADSIVEGFCFGIQIDAADHVYTRNMRIGGCWAAWAAWGSSSPDSDYGLSGFTPLDGQLWAAFAAGPANRINRLVANDGGHIGFYPLGQGVGFWKAGLAQLGKWNQWEEISDSFLENVWLKAWTFENIGHGIAVSEDGVERGRISNVTLEMCAAPHTPNQGNVFTAPAAWVAREISSLRLPQSPDLSSKWGTEAVFKCRLFNGNQFSARLPNADDPASVPGLGKRYVIAGQTNGNQVGLPGGNGTVAVMPQRSAPIRPGDRVLLGGSRAYGEKIVGPGSAANHDPIALETGKEWDAVLVQTTGRAPKYIEDANGVRTIDSKDRDGILV